WSVGGSTADRDLVHGCAAGHGVGARRPADGGPAYRGAHGQQHGARMARRRRLLPGLAILRPRPGLAWPWPALGTAQPAPDVGASHLRRPVVGCPHGPLTGPLGGRPETAGRRRTVREASSRPHFPTTRGRTIRWPTSHGPTKAPPGA